MSRQFDAIIVGSGHGGLTAGAIYAQAGHRVLVLERNQKFGGAATIYQHGALAIEASLHEIDGLDPEDPKIPILRFLGLDRAIPFVDVDDLQEVRSPLLGESFVLPTESMPRCPPSSGAFHIKRKVSTHIFNVSSRFAMRSQRSASIRMIKVGGYGTRRACRGGCGHLSAIGIRPCAR